MNSEWKVVKRERGVVPRLAPGCGSLRSSSCAQVESFVLRTAGAAQAIVGEGGERLHRRGSGSVVVGLV